MVTPVACLVFFSLKAQSGLPELCAWRLREVPCQGEGEGASSSTCRRRVVAGREGGGTSGEGTSGEGKGDGEGEDEGVSLSLSSFSVICRERAGARVMERTSRRHRERECVAKDASSSGRE